MPADRLLGTLLKALQDYAPQQDTPRLLGTTSALLVDLNNPRNVTLLIQHVLDAYPLWTQPEGLRFCLNFISVFHSATKKIIARDQEEAERKQKGSIRFSHLHAEPHLELSKWISAILEGLDPRTEKSRHLLVLTGILIGLGSEDDVEISPSLRSELQVRIVKSANAALADRNETEFGRQAVALAINHAFPYISDFERNQLNYDELLPVLMHSMLHSEEGLRSAYFLHAIDADVHQTSATQFNWAAGSPTFRQVENILASPLVSSMGAYSRLIAHAVDNVFDTLLVSSVVDDVAEFTTKLLKQWRHNKLSEIDAAEEKQYLHPEALGTTPPALWRLLRSTLFALVIVLRSAVGRLLADRTLASDAVAPQIATQCLQSLHNLNFIFARISSAAFSQYTFVHLTCVDILNSYPTAASLFLKSVAPSTTGTIPSHPLDRISDLYFLNTAEHFTLILPPSESEDLLIASATPYLTSTPTPELTPIFEAAHSVMLAVFAAPQNAEITSRHLPFYTDALFRGFPQNLSQRQFRLAFKNLVKIVSPPSVMASQQPMLAAVLLELVRERAETASPHPVMQEAAQMGQGPPMSEQVVLILALLDSLPFVELTLLEEWLPVLPGMIRHVPDEGMREQCSKHLWETIVGGSMDSERSQVCVAWWTTRGGMEAVLYGPSGAGEYVMAGALPANGAKL